MTHSFTISSNAKVQTEVFAFEEEQLVLSNNGRFTVNFNKRIRFAANSNGTNNTHAKLTPTNRPSNSPARAASSANDEIEVSLALSSNKKSLIVNPQKELAPSVDYTLTLSGIESEDGMILRTSTISIKGQEKIKTPISNIESGIVKIGSRLTLSSATNGVTIRYTTDGSTPTKSSTAYKNPIEIKGSTVIRAIALKEDMIQSDVATFYYIADLALAAKPPAISNASRSMKVGGSNFTLSVRNNIKGATHQWKSSKPSVASVSNKGVVKALKSGTTTITCTVRAGNRTFTLRSKITVTGPRVRNSTISVKRARRKTIGISNKVAGSKYRYTSSNRKIATVTNKGVVRGVRKGNTTITITITYPTRLKLKRLTIVQKIRVN
jgi:hypothetical protein